MHFDCDSISGTGSGDKDFPSLPLYPDLVIENFYMAAKTEFELDALTSLAV